MRLRSKSFLVSFFCAKLLPTDVEYRTYKEEVQTLSQTCCRAPSPLVSKLLWKFVMVLAPPDFWLPTVSDLEVALSVRVEKPLTIGPRPLFLP